MLLMRSPFSVDHILQVKSSETEIKYFSSMSGWKAMALTLSECPFSSCYKEIILKMKIMIEVNFKLAYYDVFCVGQITVVDSNLSINTCSGKFAHFGNSVDRREGAPTDARHWAEMMKFPHNVEFQFILKNFKQKYCYKFVYYFTKLKIPYIFNLNVGNGHLVFRADSQKVFGPFIRRKTDATNFFIPKTHRVEWLG